MLRLFPLRGLLSRAPGRAPCQALNALGIGAGAREAGVNGLRIEQRAREWQRRASSSSTSSETQGKAIAFGPKEPPLIESTIPEHFAGIVRNFGDRDAVISHHQDTRLSYHALDAASNALARGLTKQGIRKGDRVAVSLGNNIEYAVTTYALFKLGAILVPLNPAFNSAQIVAALTHLGSSHLLIGAETNLPRKPPASNIPLLRSLLSSLSTRDPDVLSTQIPSLQKVILIDNSQGRLDIRSDAYSVLVPYASVLEDGGDGTRELRSSEVGEGKGLSRDEVVNIQFTSGTTSTPKAACLTHRSILNNGKSIGERMGLGAGDVVCCPPPLFHCFGCILGYMATATHGASIVFPSESFNPLPALESLSAYNCTALYGVPTMFVAELELLNSGAYTPPRSPSTFSASPDIPPSAPTPSPNPPNPTPLFPNLRTGIAAGSPIPPALMSQLHSILNLTELTICYGMTETSPVSFMTGPHDPLEKRLSSVGRPLPHVEARIVDPADPRRVLDYGQKGELVVRGYLGMRGYWDDEVKTGETMVELPELPELAESGTGKGQGRGKGKWIRTGDEATLTPDSYLTITGRIKDLIIRGGENIHPLEVENCIWTHERVQEASVVGVKDDLYGEVVGAFVVLKGHRSQGSEGALVEEGEVENEAELKEELRGWVKTRLSPHLAPKYIWFVGGYPKTASGKVQKFKLREIANGLVAEGRF